MSFKRYAVYYVPEDGPFLEFGSRWLGWDIVQGTAAPDLDLADLPLPQSALTQTPRKYGFHATLKPPFYLADSETVEGLSQACAMLAQHHHAFQIDGLSVDLLSNFLALRPMGDDNLLSALAADCVKTLDRFRAPLRAEDIARRRKVGLDAKEESYLQEWGYPWVLDLFRFHITLTGKLTREIAEATQQVLARELAPLLDAPYEIGSICLMGEDENGMFHLIMRFPLHD